MAPGATGFEDLKHSIMEKVMTLPPETPIHPGHREPSTIATDGKRTRWSGSGAAWTKKARAPAR